MRYLTTNITDVKTQPICIIFNNQKNKHHCCKCCFLVFTCACNTLYNQQTSVNEKLMPTLFRLYFDLSWIHTISCDNYCIYTTVIKDHSCFNTKNCSIEWETVINLIFVCTCKTLLIRLPLGSLKSVQIRWLL